MSASFVLNALLDTLQISEDVFEKYDKVLTAKLSSRVRSMDCRCKYAPVLPFGASCRVLANIVEL
jgi:hypothetical protein